MLTVFGDRVLALGREITKAHETLAVRPISGHLAALGDERGEFTLVIAGAPENAGSPVTIPSPKELAAEFGDMTNNGAVGRREAIRALAAKYDVPAREVFSLLEKAKSYSK